MFNIKKPTLQSETKAAYSKRFLQIQRRLTRELESSRGLSPKSEAESESQSVGPDEIVANLLTEKPRFSMRTWRFYKAAVLFHLETYHPEFEAAIEQLRQESSAGLRKKGAHTSGDKRKTVPREIWDGIRKVLERRQEKGHRHAAGLLAVLRATLLTGLRPNEWAHSEVSEHEESGRDVLRVQNSKYSNGRANGEAREFFIDELTAAERDIIEAALAYCASRTDEEADRTQLALKNEFAAAIRWGVENNLLRRKSEYMGISLYSFRHQFIADAKRTFDDPVVIAALVGHNSTKTAFEHYGRRKHGRNAVRVMPTPESVEAVQKIRLESYADFVAQRGLSNQM